MTTKQKQNFTFQYSLLNGSYWMCFCTIYSFASVFLLSRGFSSAKIGIVLAIGNVLAAILQPICAAFADKSKKISLQQMIRFLSAIAIVFLIVLLLLPKSLLWVGPLFLLSLSIMQILLPLINSISVQFMNKGYSINFGVARGIGSISFAGLSYVLGFLLEKYSENIIIMLSIALFSFIILSSTLLRLPNINTTPIIPVPQQKKEIQNKSFGIFAFLKHYKKFLCFISGMILIFLYHNAINTYLIQIMQELGGNSKDMGTSLAIAAAVELPTMLAFSFLIKKFNCSTLLKTAVIFFSIKSIFFLLAGNVLMIHFTQAFQLLSFALYIPASVYYVNEIMEEQDKVKGQALATMVMTLGGVMGNLYGGWMINLAGVKIMMLVGSLLSILGTIVVLFSVESKKQQAANQ